MNLQSTQPQQVEVTAPVQDSEVPRGTTDNADTSSHSEETSSTVNVATDTMTTSTPEPTTSGIQATPSAVAPPQPAKAPVTRTTAPPITALPVLPKAIPLANQGAVEPVKEENVDKPADETTTQSETAADAEPQEAKAAVKPVFRNWAALLKAPTATKPSAGAQIGPNGTIVADGMNAGTQMHGASGIGQPGTKTLAEVLRSYRVDSTDKTAFFIEPRGLLNSGVDCYMNSVG